jgi:hypothetical protein
MPFPGWESDWQYKAAAGQRNIPEGCDSSSEAKIPMWLFVAADGSRVLSKKPVDVEIRREGPDRQSFVSAYVFSCNKLHVFASASTRNEAESQFHDQVVHFCRMYWAAAPDELAEDAAAIKALYDENFEDANAAT